jgi:3-isopropylmalate/(R)-2-methylmalate dehydratase large subunit
MPRSPWRRLRTDDDAVFDAEVVLDRRDPLTPFVTWGTNPGQGLPLSASVPDPDRIVDETERVAPNAHWSTWAWSLAPRCARSPSTRSSSARAPTAGSRTCVPPPRCCRGRQVADGVRMLVVPGSARVRVQAEAEGLHEVFEAAGAEWRLPGCSMCLAMNPTSWPR